MMLTHVVQLVALKISRTAGAATGSRYTRYPRRSIRRVQGIVSCGLTMFLELHVLV
jgi:hypothetical protein